MALRSIVALFLASLGAPGQTGSGLSNQIEQIASMAHGHVGVDCLLNGADMGCGYHQRDRFPMQSVYKLPITMAMLDAIERNEFSLEQSVRFLPADQISPGQHSPLRDAHPKANVDIVLEAVMRLAVSESDGVASDILLRLLGGPPVVDAYVRRLGITGLHIADTEKTLGRDVSAQYRNDAQPAAIVLLLDKLARHSPLNAGHTELLMRWMTESPTGAHRLKALLPAATPVAHKTGTSGTDNGLTHATNDVGIITLPDGRKLCIAVFVSDSTASEAVRESLIAKLAQAVWIKAASTGIAFAPLHRALQAPVHRKAASNFGPSWPLG